MNISVNHNYKIEKAWKFYNSIMQTLRLNQILNNEIY